MILGMEIGLLIAGIVALVTGKMKVSKTKVALGTPARIAGVVAVLPLPVSFMVGLAIGASRVANGRNLDDDKGWLIVLELAIVLTCLAVSLIIAFATAKPIVPPTPPSPMNQVPPPQPPPLP